MSLEYIREAYGVPAKIGAIVIVDGVYGAITGSRMAYLRIRLNGRKKSGFYHPTWKIQYITEDEVKR